MTCAMAVSKILALLTIMIPVSRKIVALQKMVIVSEGHVRGILMTHLVCRWAASGIIWITRVRGQFANQLRKKANAETISTASSSSV